MILNDPQITFNNLLYTDYTLKVLDWRNQEYVRNNMIDSSVIPLENHKRYIEKLKNSDTQEVYIAFLADAPLAVMTFVITDDFVESGSYLVNEEDLGKGYGVITGYARFEYIFNNFPNRKMRTIILEHNKKNISLQKNFGCLYEGMTTVTKSDGTQENAFIYTMTKEQWEAKKEKIQRLISRLIPIDNIDLSGLLRN